MQMDIPRIQGASGLCPLQLRPGWILYKPGWQAADLPGSADLNIPKGGGAQCTNVPEGGEIKPTGTGTDSASSDTSGAKKPAKKKEKTTKHTACLDVPGGKKMRESPRM